MPGDLAPRALPECGDTRPTLSRIARRDAPALDAAGPGEFAGFVIAATSTLSDGTAEAADLTIHRSLQHLVDACHELEDTFAAHGALCVPCALYLLDRTMTATRTQLDGWYVVLEEWLTDRPHRRHALLSAHFHAVASIAPQHAGELLTTAGHLRRPHRRLLLGAAIPLPGRSPHQMTGRSDPAAG
ncbi:hypothetical protein [Nocardia sp. IFM 10818]